MKKTDIAMIILIAAIGVGVGYAVASNISFLKVPERGAQVQTVQEISPDVQKPDPNVFKSDAINPTVEVFVGQGATK